MNITQIVKEVETFINDSRNMVIEYQKKAEDFDQKISKGLSTPTLAQKELTKMRNDNQSKLWSAEDRLDEEVLEWGEKQRTDILEDVSPITQDNVAELTLLSQVDVTSEELNRYIKKYQGNTLAIKKLKEISANKELFNTQFPKSKNELVDELVSRIRGDLSYFRQPNYNSIDASLNMVADGSIEKQKEKLAEYLENERNSK